MINKDKLINEIKQNKFLIFDEGFKYILIRVKE